MTKPTVAQLQLQLEDLRSQVANLTRQAEAPRRAYRASTAAALNDDPAAKAAYVRDFFKRRQRAKNKAALNAPVPGESPTTKAYMERIAKELGVPLHELSMRGGSIYHHGKFVV